MFDQIYFFCMHTPFLTMIYRLLWYLTKHVRHMPTLHLGHCACHVRQHTSSSSQLVASGDHDHPLSPGCIEGVGPLRGGGEILLACCRGSSPSPDPSFTLTSIFFLPYPPLYIFQKLDII